MRIDRKKYELARARACISQKDIEDAGIPRATLYGAISRNIDVRPETAGKIAKALGVDVTEIIETDNK